MKNKCKDFHQNEVQLAIDFFNSIEQFENNKIKTIRDHHSGGGCMHLLFHLDDKRIFVFHHTNDAEISHGKWNTLSEYIWSDQSLDNYEELGLGWEWQLPNYKDRLFSFDFDYLSKSRKPKDIPTWKPLIEFRVVSTETIRKEIYVMAKNWEHAEEIASGDVDWEILPSEVADINAEEVES